MTVTIQGGYDANRLGSLVVTITETGGGGAVKAATLAATYMPSLSVGLNLVVMNDDGAAISPYASTYYASALAALNTAFSTGLTSVITVSIVAGKWRFSSSGTGGVTAIAVSFNTAALAYFGAAGTHSGALTHTMDYPASRYIQGDVGGLSELVPPHEVSDGLAEDILTNDGTKEGMSLPGAVYEMECVIPIEPAAKVWHDRTSVANDGTWEIFFRQTRNIEPITIDDGTSGRIYAIKLRADSCAFEPELLSENYLAYANIRLRGHYLGELL